VVGVLVMFEFDEIVELEIVLNDICIDVFCFSGFGG